MRCELGNRINFGRERSPIIEHREQPDNLEPVGAQPRDGIQHALSAAHAHEPIVRERDARARPRRDRHRSAARRGEFGLRARLILSSA